MSNSEFSDLNRNLTKEEKPKKKFLYERTIDEIISHARCKNPKENQRTTIYIPLPQEIALKDLQDKYKQSAFCTMRYTVQHGFSIFEHENKNILNQINEIRKTLRHSKNSLIPNYLYKLVIEIGKNDNNIKRALMEDRNILAAMKNCSSELNINFTSFIHVLINYSLSTTKDNNLTEVQLKAEKSKIKFQKTINEILDILIRFMSGEKDVEKEVGYDINDIVEVELEDEEVSN